jgi:hypothetical protein
LKLEQLWISEQNSLTYKAGYSLMAFQRCRYTPSDGTIISKTIDWLSKNQEEDGGFSPWKGHPVDSDVYCTSIALLGLMHSSETGTLTVLKRGLYWLLNTRLKTGLWKYHEIEDGASWGLLTATELMKRLSQ